jgi:hypothetical protein
VAAFFAKCGEMSDDPLSVGQELMRDLYHLFEQTRAAYFKDSPACEAVRGTIASVPPAVDVVQLEADDNLAKLEAAIDTFKANASTVSDYGQKIAKTLVTVERASTNACQGSEVAMEDTASNFESSANLAVDLRTQSGNMLAEIFERRRESEALYEQIAPILQLLPQDSESKPTAAERLAAISDLSTALEASGASGVSLPDLEAKAIKVYDQMVAILQPLEDETATRILADGADWLIHIQGLSSRLTACRSELQTALETLNAAETASTTNQSEKKLPNPSEATKALEVITKTADQAGKDEEAVRESTYRTELCLTNLRLRALAAYAKETSDTLSAACQAGEERAEIIASGIAKIEALLSKATTTLGEREDQLQKLENLIDKALGYVRDAESHTVRAREDQKQAENIVRNACKELRRAKNAQSSGEIRAILSDIQSAVSSCKSLKQSIKSSAEKAKGAASACESVVRAMALMSPPSPMPELQLGLITLKGKLDALKAIVASAKGRSASLKAVQGRAVSLLATGRDQAANLKKQDFATSKVSELEALVSRIKSLQDTGNCRETLAGALGQSDGRLTALQGVEHSLTGRIHRLNSILGGASRKGLAEEQVGKAANYADMAGWMVGGMQETLVSVASCQAAVEKLLGQALHAESVCSQRSRMRAEKNGGEWVCTCIDPSDRLTDRGCVVDDCPRLKVAFINAVNSGNIKRGHSILTQSAHCEFANHGPGYIRQAQCNKNASAFTASIASGQLNRASAVLNASRDCGFAGQASVVLQTAYALYNKKRLTRKPPRQPSKPSKPSTNGATTGGGKCSGGGINLLCTEAGAAASSSPIP